jgi:molybdenum cofactor guanylyltransferase
VCDAAGVSEAQAAAGQMSMDAESVTGVLLVGGASRRFGTPKALATLRGERLAERAWRSIDWCDERLAFGKASDALQLSFPVLDDGSPVRAPIVGVVAALRASRHDVCLCLPVDCPLVTDAALRELAQAVAVPQTGPLPGAYSKEMLPALEARLRSGQLSLRGVNSRVLEVDPAVLVNVNTEPELRALGPD